ncbi:MAG: RICIN domain-containing protein, partial [Anaerovorax sp.]
MKRRYWLLFLVMLVMVTICFTFGTAYADQLDSGIYNFRCVDGGRYLNVYAGQDKDGANVCVWDKDGSPEQNFKLVDRGGNKYVLYPQSSSSGRVLDANRGNS